jgi:hypothetical protein
MISSMRLDQLRRVEWIVAVLLSLMVLFLIAVRVNHAGALWRDECAVVQLARMPDVSDITRNFQHEAFPVPFPILIRGYTNLFSASDTSLRVFGAAVGLALLCALWLSARYAGDGLPIVSLSLLGLNTTFLIWGLTIRGYGLGSIFAILTFGLFAALLGKPSSATVVAAVLLAIAAVQCLVHNLVLVFALAMSATVICLLRRDARSMALFLAILALCALSFLPYLNAYTSGSPWSIVAESPLTFRSLSQQFILATGDPSSAFASCWAIAFLVLLSATTLRLYHLRRRPPTSEWDLLLYLLLVPLIAAVGYYLFLHLLNYLARPWYFLALLSILAVSLDGLASSRLTVKWIRVSRLLVALAALAVLPFYVWPKIIERQSNIDVVAKKVTELAKPADLIVVAPWQYGISFNRYYRGATPWITLPKIADLRVHRYDLFREKMVSPHPIDDVLEEVRRALAAGNRVWFVGGLTQLQENAVPRFLSPAPDPTSGWDNRAYNRSWLDQLSAFVRAHGERGHTVPLPSASPVNELENVPLMVVEGWQ